MSQVFRGDRDLTVEQAVDVAKFIGLSASERQFLLLLVQRARAGTSELAAILTEQIEAARQSSQTLKNRIKHSKLNEIDRSIFYSEWYYSAIRLGLSIEKLNTLGAIADHLDLDRNLVTKVIRFLRENQLIVEKNGKFDLGPQVTHVEHDSPYVNRHRTNWRLKGLQALQNVEKDNLFYTGPMALSASAAQGIRENLVELIERSTRAAAGSKSEILACLNIDWFSF
jgi:Domain of unknown function (DUF4423)